MTTIMARACIIYLAVVVSMRVLGKRQIGELEAGDLVSTILMGELAALPMQANSIPLTHALIPILTILGLQMLLSTASLHSIRIRELLSGKSSVIIEEGRINQRELRRNRITVDEVIQELRQKEITDISNVQYAVLETNGALSTILYPEYQTAKTGAVSSVTEKENLPYIIINDGRWVDENIGKSGLDHSIIWRELNKRHVSDIKDVFLLLADSQGKVYFLPREKEEA